RRLCPPPSRSIQPAAGEQMLQGNPEHAQAVGYRAPEVDRRGVAEIVRRAADLAYAMPARQDLSQHLVVENEVVRVAVEIELLEDVRRKSAVTGVILRQLGTRAQVLEGGKKPVGNVLVDRHAAAEGAAAENAR